MIIYLESVYGDTKADLERARAEVERALGFRGSLTDIKARGKRIEATIEVNPKWDLPADEKLNYLREWLPNRVRHFRVEFRG